MQSVVPELFTTIDYIPKHCSLPGKENHFADQALSGFSDHPGAVCDDETVFSISFNGSRIPPWSRYDLHMLYNLVP